MAHPEAFCCWHVQQFKVDCVAGFESCCGVVVRIQICVDIMLIRTMNTLVQVYAQLLLRRTRVSVVALL